MLTDRCGGYGDRRIRDGIGDGSSGVFALSGMGWHQSSRAIAHVGLCEIGLVVWRLWPGSDGAVGRAGGDGHTSSETGAPDWLDRGVASDRRRWAERAWIGCALVWLCGCLVHVVHVVRALRRTGLVGDWACGADASMCGGR